LFPLDRDAYTIELLATGLFRVTLINDLDLAERGETIDRMKALLGPKGWSTDPDKLAPHLRDWRGRYTGSSALLLQPASTAEVQQIVKLAAAAHIPLVAQGGNTGLVQGGVPDATGEELILSLQRMNRIRSIDADDFSMVVDSGCILATVQAAAEAADRLFPLSLGSEGTATIGGLTSTNAGGVAVLRYGTMRALVLGVEAVLANGALYEGLTPLRKDNTGYDLKHLLIGAEGTLGIITGVTLRLFPRPRGRATAFVNVPSPAVAVQLLAALRSASGDQVSAFELISRYALDLVLTHISGVRDPLPTRSDWSVLIELTGPQSDDEVRDVLEAGLALGLERGWLTDAAVATSMTQAKDFWRIRETIPEAEKLDGGSLNNDVSVSPSRMPEFIETASEALLRAHPDCRILAFGHLGDGNIHFHLRQGTAGPSEAFFAKAEAVHRLVNDQLAAMGGSISAEHGIGQLKAEELARTASPVKLAAMKAIKAALDPHNLFGRGRILDRP
jgi:FAD/FMN-containing dehydrogenase